MNPGTLLREARATAGVSQTELARLSGSSQSAVARRENGDEDPTIATLRRLLFACGERLVLQREPLPPSPRREGLRQARALVMDRIARSGGSNVRLFGSVARGEDDDGSDIDLLVDLPHSLSRGSKLVRALGLSDELSSLLELRVDVSTPDVLRPAVRRNALRESVLF
ncbi:MAG: XRE family transcriptional regulator [Gaiellaceae bacterium MAG52_C11]|nr:XRE family transcriptional regulator [Candidatus Gaiellasilicea maunaloa]